MQKQQESEETVLSLENQGIRMGSPEKFPNDSKQDAIRIIESIHQKANSQPLSHSSPPLVVNGSTCSSKITPSLTSLLLSKVTASLTSFEPHFIHSIPFPLLLACLSSLQNHISIDTMLTYFPPHLFPHESVPALNFQLNGSLDTKVIHNLKGYRIGSLNLSHCLLSDETFKKTNGEAHDSTRKSRKRSSSSSGGSSAKKSAIFDLLDLEMQNIRKSERPTSVETSRGVSMDPRNEALRGGARKVTASFMNPLGNTLESGPNAMGVAASLGANIHPDHLLSHSKQHVRSSGSGKKKRKKKGAAPLPLNDNDAYEHPNRRSSSSNRARSREKSPRGSRRSQRKRSYPLSIPQAIPEKSAPSMHRSGSASSSFTDSPAILSASSAPQSSMFLSSMHLVSAPQQNGSNCVTPGAHPKDVVSPLFQSVRSLNVSYIPHLSSLAIKSIASNFPALRMLSMESNAKINNSCLKLIAKRMPHLVALNIRGCRNVSSLKELQPLKSLEILNVSFIPRLSLIGECNKFAPKLTYLNISNCPKIQSIDDLDASAFKCLKSLDLSNCSDIAHVDKLTHLQSLESLSISNLSSLTNIESVGELRSLRKLYLSGCKGLHSILPVKNLSHLKNLDISKTRIALDEDVELFASMPHLKALNIGFCPVESVEALKCASSLEHLNHSGVQLENIDEWRQLYNVLPNIRSIHASQCFLSTYETDYCPFDSSMENHQLTHLNLCGCTLVNDEWMVQLPPHITFLDISNTSVTPRGLKSLISLSEGTLHSLIAKNVLQEDILNLPLSTEHLCEAFSLIGNCSNLHTLDISNSTVSNEMLFELRALKLRHFDITNCNKISNPKTLLLLGDTLQVLNMNGILISDSFLSQFPKCMHQLHTLRMSVSRFLTDKGMDSIHEMQNLVYLRTNQFHLKPI